jgi:YD repeat-containing protein
MTGKITLSATFLLLCLLVLPPGHADADIVSYEYDAFDQLVRMEQSDGTVIVYEYDDNGNRTTKTSTVEDDDNDGLPNGLENRGCTSLYDADTDDDGIADGMEDADHNGVRESTETDPCNIDTDGDGIQDGTELGITAGVADPDGAGPMSGTDTLLFQPDLDPLTTTDTLNEDSDGDGKTDGEEDTNFNGRVDAGESDPNAVDAIDFNIVPILFLLLSN